MPAAGDRPLRCALVRLPRSHRDGAVAILSEEVGYAIHVDASALLYVPKTWAAREEALWHLADFLAPYPPDSEWRLRLRVRSRRAVPTKRRGSPCPRNVVEHHEGFLPAAELLRAAC